MVCDHPFTLAMPLLIVRKDFLKGSYITILITVGGRIELSINNGPSVTRGNEGIINVLSLNRAPDVTLNPLPNYEPPRPKSHLPGAHQ